MPASRPFEALKVEEVKRLLELAIEGSTHTDKVTPRLQRAYAALAAQVSFELWSREQVRLNTHRACGRALGRGYAPQRRHVH
jgi:hypothetical protein